VLRSLTTLAPLALALLAGCHTTPDRSPCADFDCSGHGTCAAVPTAAGAVATCLCQPGYSPSASGWLCLPQSDGSLCAGVTCSGHGTCASVQGKARCLCADGFAASADGLGCGDPCAGVTCSGHGSCTVSGSLARCECQSGYRLSTDGLTCAAGWPDTTLVYQLTSDQYPDWIMGRMNLDLGQQASGRLTESVSFDLYIDHTGGGGGWKGLFRRSLVRYDLDASGLEVKGLEFDDSYTEGNVGRRRWGKASFAGGAGSVTFQRLDKLASSSLSYTGKAPPVPMLGGLEHPGWSLGCFSPVFYTLALRRYDKVKKGTQQLEVFWPEASAVGTVTVTADAAYTDEKPVLSFPDQDLVVTYQDELPLTIHLVGEEMTWTRSVGTPADLNLGPAKTATAFTPAALPTDLTETTTTFSSADGTTLAGALTRPTGKSGALPAVLLVSDLFAKDRDAPFSRLPQIDLFRHLAAHLAHAGYASLRFDPRGHGASKGDATKATLAALTADVGAALDALAGATSIDKDKVFVLSFSTASLLALSALPGKQVRGYIALTPVLKELEKMITYSAIAHVKAAGFSTNFQTQQAQQIGATLQKLKDGTFEQPVYRTISAALWKELLTLDGTSLLTGFNGPVLALRGDADLQVPPEQLEAITASGKQSLTVKTLTGTTHLFAAAAASDPLWESAVLPLDLPATTLDAILTWLAAN